ncbi:MAG TPA: protein phosphatase 2C domain-containing protein [Methanomicrobiales archaeon]|nr:protein phosphatase 2C domain-containing protein [Methanomicrobiales archaeon]
MITRYTEQHEECEILKVGRCACGSTHAGGRAVNEDALVLRRLKDGVLLMVADGLGGHSAGEEASRIAVDTLCRVMESGYQQGMGASDVQDLLSRGHRDAHERILEHATGDREGMGTTLVSAFARGAHAVIANTGDSRAQVIGERIAFTTRDHSLVQGLVDRGDISRGAARNHPLRHIVTRALGVDFEVDLYEVRLDRREVLLLSSDGLHDYVDDTLLVQAAGEGDPCAVVRHLMHAALPVTQDNLTVCVYKDVSRSGS